MRTMKALLVTAAVGAVGIATSMADPVYSANVVGFVNLTLPVGWSLISNPLQGTNNALSTIIPAPEEGTFIYKWTAATQMYENSSGFNFGAWDIDYTIAPGEGIWINVPNATTLTFVGEVRQGNLSTPLSPNFNLIGSQVPQAGFISTTLGYGAAEGDQVYQFDAATQQFNNAAGFNFGSWDPEPTLAIGEAVFLITTDASAWTRTFNVQ